MYLGLQDTQEFSALITTPSSPILATADLSSVPIWPFPECHIVGVTQYVAIPDWLLSLSNMTAPCFLALNNILLY